jgi:hypothetical protein
MFRFRETICRKGVHIKGKVYSSHALTQGFKTGVVNLYEVLKPVLCENSLILLF